MANSILAPARYGLPENQRAMLRPPVMPGVTEAQLQCLANAQKNYVEYAIQAAIGVPLLHRKNN